MAAATTAAIFGVRWDPAAGYSSFSSFFFFMGPVGPCRTCTRTGPRSTVTAFHLTSPCPSHDPLSLPCATLTAFPLFLLLLLVPFPSYALSLLSRRFYSVFLSSSSLVSSLCFSTISPSFLSEIFTIPCSTINYFDL